MTNTQLFVISKVIEWCNNNLERMKGEDKTQKDIVSACVDSISQYEVIHPNVVHQYVDACMA
ncbi:MAG: hypothetical protein Q7U36_01430 [bacterium]|nr:hypothetical protein [bacterium]